MKVEISKRRMKRLERADKVAREVLYLMATDGHIGGANYMNLRVLLDSWRSMANTDQYERPL